MGPPSKRISEFRPRPPNFKNCLKDLGTGLTSERQVGLPSAFWTPRFARLMMCAEVERMGAPFMDLGEWLRSLGLEEYEVAFRDNKINERVVSSLTAEDL